MTYKDKGRTRTRTQIRYTLIQQRRGLAANEVQRWAHRKRGKECSRRREQEEQKGEEQRWAKGMLYSMSVDHWGDESNPR